MEREGLTLRIMLEGMACMLVAEQRRLLCINYCREELVGHQRKEIVSTRFVNAQ